jgi:hypothetical protein
MLKLVLVGVLIVGAMFLVKDGRVMRDAGLTGSCVVAETFKDGSQLEACSAGKLAGRPSLSRQGCTATAILSGNQYWRCPAGVASGPNGD